MIAMTADDRDNIHDGTFQDASRKLCALKAYDPNTKFIPEIESKLVMFVRVLATRTKNVFNTTAFSFDYV